MLDLLTTVVFLLYGLQEANPVVNLALKMTASPLIGLMLVKMVALALGIWCWRVGRGRLLARMNVLFAALISWNLLALIVNQAAR